MFYQVPKFVGTVIFGLCEFSLFAFILSQNIKYINKLIAKLNYLTEQQKQFKIILQNLNESLIIVSS